MREVGETAAVELKPVVGAREREAPSLCAKSQSWTRNAGANSAKWRDRNSRTLRGSHSGPQPLYTAASSSTVCAPITAEPSSCASTARSLSPATSASLSVFAFITCSLFTITC